MVLFLGESANAIRQEKEIRVISIGGVEGASHCLNQNLSNHSIIKILIVIKTLHFQSCTDKRTQQNKPFICPHFPSGLIPPREAPGERREKDALATRASNANGDKEEKTVMKKL
jgi:hypothetical protein